MLLPVGEINLILYTLIMLMQLGSWSP